MGSDISYVGELFRKAIKPQQKPIFSEEVRCSRIWIQLRSVEQTVTS